MTIKLFLKRTLHQILKQNSRIETDKLDTLNDENSNDIDYKFGALPAKFDERTFKLTAILKSTEALPPIPSEYDVDKILDTNIKNKSLGNDFWGNCVIVARANAVWRYEFFEQKYQIPISTDDCLNQYWKEQNGYIDNWLIRWILRIFHLLPDKGLVILDSLKNWRKGWMLNGYKYDIYAFASIQTGNFLQLKQSVALLNGAYVGIRLSEVAMNDYRTGRIWSDTSDSKIKGYHAVYVVAYNDTGPICVTWGKRQQMTWDFYNKYCVEAYAIVDNRNVWMTNSPVDCVKLNQYLDAISN